jgi:hypothetical protein
VVFTRAIVVPVWIVAFLLVALFASRAGVATALLLFPLVALAIIAAVAMTILRGTRRVRPRSTT